VTSLTDQQLLRDYAERRSEAAFAELVRRHVDLVHSAAVRMVRDAQLAEDVTQGVFVAFAQNAPQLTDRPVLAGWLHRTTQNLAANTVRSEVRRRVREQEAAAMNELFAAVPDAAWEHIAPHLDAALGELGEADRDALLLRYFQRKSAHEMAQILGVSDEAAQKRVSRAVERLREFFAQRGITVGASGLVVILTANAVQAAPAGLALSISISAALAGTALTAVTSSTAAKAIVMTTLQKVLVATTLVAAIGAGMYEARQASHLRAQIKTIQQDPLPVPGSSNAVAFAALQEKLDRLAAENGELSSALAQANSDKARLEVEREQARHSAALFKELADKAGSKDQNPTNDYPTARHVMAGWGRLGRLAAQVKKDQDNLTPEEKSAREAAKLDALGEMAKLMTAMKQIGMDKKPSEEPSSEEASDLGACLLYGALSLNEQQFGEVYGLLGKFKQQAKQDHLLEENPTPEAAAALKQLNAQAKAEIQGLLTPEQAALFEQIAPQIQVGAQKIDLNFKF
jgi:RNA polymerase sigma factor (sigma-70 family)